MFYPGNKLGDIKNLVFADDSVITNIGEGAFSQTNIDTLVLPQTVTSIGELAFAYSTLSSVTLSSGLTTLPFGCFFGCKNLTEIVLTEGMTSVGQNVFGNTPLKKITIPSTLATLDYNAFACGTIEEIIISPDNQYLKLVKQHEAYFVIPYSDEDLLPDYSNAIRGLSYGDMTIDHDATLTSS
jgi:hypothetical protein